MIQGLTELVEFYERLETAEDIFHTQGVENYKNKKTKQSGESHQSAKSEKSKGSKQAAKPSEEDTNKNAKTKNKNPPVCHLHGPRHNMNLFKVMQAHEKYTKSTWSTNCSNGAGRVRFQGTKKCLAEGQYMNALVGNAVEHVIKQNKRAKAMAENDSRLEEAPENFNFEKISIREK